MRLELTPSDVLNLERDDEFATAAERQVRALEAQIADVRTGARARFDRTVEAIFASHPAFALPKDAPFKVERDPQGAPVAIVWDESKTEEKK